VVARSFGAPAVTAECAVGFLRPGGRLAVSEPPECAEPASVRWPEAGLGHLGFAPPARVQHAAANAVVLELPAAPADRWPRRDGVPAKRPLW
jgi:16S rRNA (guanine527-N7)-methyltransferase